MHHMQVTQPARLGNVPRHLSSLIGQRRHKSPPKTAARVRSAAPYCSAAQANSSLTDWRHSPMPLFIARLRAALTDGTPRYYRGVVPTTLTLPLLFLKCLTWDSRIKHKNTRATINCSILIRFFASGAIWRPRLGAIVGCIEGESLGFPSTDHHVIFSRRWLKRLPFLRNMTLNTV